MKTLVSSAGVILVLATASPGCAGDAFVDAPGTDEGTAAIVAVGPALVDGCDVTQTFDIASSTALGFVAARGNGVANLGLALFSVAPNGALTEVAQQAHALGANAAANQTTSSSQFTSDSAHDDAARQSSTSTHQAAVHGTVAIGAPGDVHTGAGRGASVGGNAGASIAAHDGTGVVDPATADAVGGGAIGAGAGSQRGVTATLDQSTPAIQRTVDGTLTVTQSFGASVDQGSAAASSLVTPSSAVSVEESHQLAGAEGFTGLDALASNHYALHVRFTATQSTAQASGSLVDLFAGTNGALLATSGYSTSVSSACP